MHSPKKPSICQENSCRTRADRRKSHRGWVLLHWSEVRARLLSRRLDRALGLDHARRAGSPPKDLHLFPFRRSIHSSQLSSSLKPHIHFSLFWPSSCLITRHFSYAPSLLHNMHSFQSSLPSRHNSFTPVLAHQFQTTFSSFLHEHIRLLNSKGLQSCQRSKCCRGRVSREMCPTSRAKGCTDRSFNSHCGTIFLLTHF